MKSCCDKKQALWKWAVELVIGVPILFGVYVASQQTLNLHSNVGKIALLLFSSVAIIGIFLLLTRLFEKEWRCDLYSQFVAKNLFFGIFVGTAFFGLVAGVLSIVGCGNIKYASPSVMILFVNLVFYLLVAVGEEVIFRGIIFRMIDERFGLWWALAVSALIFGFIHIICPNASIWSSIAIAIEAGVLIGAAFKCSGSLWLPIGIHWAWNFMQGNVFGFSVSGHDKEESIFNTELSGSDLITGGDFGPEASVIALIMGAIISALFIWWYLKRTRGASAE